MHVHVGQTLWPVLMFTTSLPPEVRMNVENMLVGALWLGPCKPSMEVLLPPVLSKIDLLFNNGLEFNTQHGKKVLKAKIVAAVFDFPAKAMALNVVQFNGYYGCPYCKDRGIHKCNRHLYLPQEPHIAREPSDIVVWARKAEEILKPVFGVKGFSMLMKYVSIHHIPIDYMHAILLGITKQFLECWINSDYSDRRFYLGNNADDIDACLLRIKPPHEFRSTPRPIKKMLFYWKSSEFKAWLLYYSLPIIVTYLPSDYVNHFALLISAMHILLSCNISCQDLTIAEEFLLAFYNQVPDLYPDTILSANVHTSIHLCHFVRLLGPLWAYSTFGFENMNGYIKKHRHGTRNFLPSLARAISMTFSVSAYRNELSPSDSLAIDFLKEDNILNGAHGKIHCGNLLDYEYDALQEAGFHLASNDVTTFPYYTADDKTSYHIRKNTLRDSSVCEFLYGSDLLLGSIRCFCITMEGPVAIIGTFERMTESILSDITFSKPIYSRNALQLSHYFVKVKKLSVSNTVLAVSVNCIKRKCIHISIAKSQTDIIVFIPNNYEHH